ncbi:hypothetical protein P692DRAFT_20878762 [Suillus brevipes Sb2]|nr:hypothetical protein P692DRAFT_20878762 [Suillus brevipes Sb2]
MGFCDGAVSPSVTGLAQIQLLPFTIQTIRLSRCLEKLRLSSVKLSSAQWDKLLCHFVIPTLVELRVDGECVPPMLIRFLARHPAISNLSIIPPPGGPWRTNQIITPLTLSLSILDGPLSHLLPPTIYRPTTSPPFCNVSAIATASDILSFPCLMVILVQQ